MKAESNNKADLAAAISEFKAELKAELARLRLQWLATLIMVDGILFAALHLWPPHP